MSDIFEFLYDLWGAYPYGDVVITLFTSILVLICFSTLIQFLFGIVSQFFRR